MIKTTLFALCLSTGIAYSAEPPDWYAHIPPQQQAALLATRSAQLGHAAIGVLAVQRQRVRDSERVARYTGEQRFDASALVHPNEYSLLYHNLTAAREREWLRYERQPARRTHQALERALGCGLR